MKPLIFAIGDKHPQIHETAFIAPGAVIAGDVEVHENASVWYGCVLRGDVNKIVVGKGSNGLCCKHGARPRGVTQLGD